MLLVAFGGITSTVAKIMGDFTEKALLDSGSEDVVMTDGGLALQQPFSFTSLQLELSSSS